VEYEGRSDDGSGNQQVQDDAAGEVAAEIVVEEALAAREFDVSGYGCLLTSATAG
jgi:hypothetical protein